MADQARLVIQLIEGKGGVPTSGQAAGTPRPREEAEPPQVLARAMDALRQVLSNIGVGRNLSAGLINRAAAVVQPYVGVPALPPSAPATAAAATTAPAATAAAAIAPVQSAEAQAPAQGAAGPARPSLLSRLFGFLGGAASSVVQKSMLLLSQATTLATQGITALHAALTKPHSPPIAEAIVLLAKGAVVANEAVMNFAVAVTDSRSSILGAVNGIGQSFESAGKKVLLVGAGVVAFGAAVALVFPPLGAILMAAGATIAVLGASAAIAGKALQAFAKVVDNLTEISARYAGVNAQIAIAEAQGDIRLLLGDIRRGRELAGPLSGFVEARTALVQKQEDIKAAFIKRIAPVAEAGLRILEALLPSAETVEVMLKILDAQLEIAKATPVGYVANKILDHLKEEARKRDLAGQESATDLIFQNPNPLDVFQGLPRPGDPPPGV